MQLSKNFTLQELTRNGRDFKNSPNAEQIGNLIALCNMILEPVREHFKSPVIITSGFRSALVNKAVGGAPTSQHTKGEAVDFHLKGVANQEVYKFIRDTLVFDQLIAEKLSRINGAAGWIHVSYKLLGNRNEAISFLGAGKYVSGLKFTD